MFKLINYFAGGNSDSAKARVGIVFGSGEEVHDLAALAGDQDFSDIAIALERFEHVTDIAKTIPAAGTGVGEVGELTLAAPVPQSASIFCAAANFSDHMLAMARKLGIEREPDPHELDVKPYHFLKAARQTLRGDRAVVALPDHAETVDWEIELAAVIGRPTRNVSVADALTHVLGYTIANDLSVRDLRLMKRPNVPDGSLFRTDFIGMKSFDGSCPIGPWIIPAQFVDDPQSLEMRLSVNGEMKQNSSTAKMVFSTAEQIAYLSSVMTLLPGDVILTGTPAGTGAESDVFLKPGDEIECRIEGIGSLQTKIAE